MNANNRKLTKSLIFIIALNLFGVFLKSMVNMLFQSFVVVNIFVKTSVSIAFSFFTITVYSANAPVLYIISTEYRNRFQQSFPWLIKVKGLGSAVTSVSAVQPQSTVVRRPCQNNNNNKYGTVSYGGTQMFGKRTNANITKLCDVSRENLTTK
ncbi:hypothetical protein niasHT_002475 [Heterodera trifolii]|uniref:Uncharacterized protein n=1 Tax=Heterodera trifolii TaxID=157864 RepID=A0ABD2LMD4_9BILA